MFIVVLPSRRECHATLHEQGAAGGIDLSLRVPIYSSVSQKPTDDAVKIAILPETDDICAVRAGIGMLRNPTSLFRRHGQRGIVL